MIIIKGLDQTVTYTAIIKSVMYCMKHYRSMYRNERKMLPLKVLGLLQLWEITL